MTTLREIHWAVFHGELPLHMAVELSGNELAHLWKTATDDDVHLMTELVVETGGVLPVSLGLDLATAAANLLGLERPESWHALLEQGHRTAQSGRRTKAFETAHHKAALELDNAPGSIAWGGWNAVASALNAVNDLLNDESPLEISRTIIDVSYFARSALVAFCHPNDHAPIPDPALNGTTMARLVIAAARAPTVEQLVNAASANAIGQGRMT